MRGSMNVSTVSTPTSTTTSLLTVGKTTRHNAKYLPDSRRIKKGSRGRRGDREEGHNSWGVTAEFRPPLAATASAASACRCGSN